MESDPETNIKINLGKNLLEGYDYIFQNDDKKIYDAICKERPSLTILSGYKGYIQKSINFNITKIAIRSDSVLYYKRSSLKKLIKRILMPLMLKKKMVLSCNR